MTIWVKLACEVGTCPEQSELVEVDQADDGYSDYGSMPSGAVDADNVPGWYVDRERVLCPTHWQRAVAADRKRNEDWEREQYERLKAKFG